MLCDSGRSSIHVSGFLGVTSSPLVHQVLLGVLAPAGFAFEFGEIDDEVGLALEFGHIDLDLCFAFEISAINNLRRCGQADQRQN